MPGKSPVQSSFSLCSHPRPQTSPPLVRSQWFSSYFFFSIPDGKEPLFGAKCLCEQNCNQCCGCFPLGGRIYRQMETYTCAVHTRPRRNPPQEADLNQFDWGGGLWRRERGEKKGKDTERRNGNRQNERKSWHLRLGSHFTTESPHLLTCFELYTGSDALRWNQIGASHYAIIMFTAARGSILYNWINIHCIDKKSNHDALTQAHISHICCCKQSRMF